MQLDVSNALRRRAKSSSVKPLVPTTACTPLAAAQATLRRAASTRVKSTTTSTPRAAMAVGSGSTARPGDVDADGVAEVEAGMVGVDGADQLELGVVGHRLAHHAAHAARRAEHSDPDRHGATLLSPPWSPGMVGRREMPVEAGAGASRVSGDGVRPHTRAPPALAVTGASRRAVLPRFPRRPRPHRVGGAAHPPRRHRPVGRRPAPASASSAPTAPASRPCCAPSPASTSPRAARCACPPRRRRSATSPRSPTPAPARPWPTCWPGAPAWRRPTGDLDAATAALAADEPGAADRYAAALDRWMALGGADLDARAAAIASDLGLPGRPGRPAGRGAVGRAGRPRPAGGPAAGPVRRLPARRAHQRPRLRRPRPAAALRRRPGRAVRDRVARPGLPRAHGHARSPRSTSTTARCRASTAAGRRSRSSGPAPAATPRRTTASTPRSATPCPTAPAPSGPGRRRA